ncbi:hypothetical protein [Rhodobacter capsulatus]|nr:hypothetical protein [Rhodobacter capsulatus]
MPKLAPSTAAIDMPLADPTAGLPTPAPRTGALPAKQRCWRATSWS